jgi:hypothetical protein
VVGDERACFVDPLCSLKGCAVRAVAEAICACRTHLHVRATRYLCRAVLCVQRMIPHHVDRRSFLHWPHHNLRDVFAAYVAPRSLVAFIQVHQNCLHVCGHPSMRHQMHATAISRSPRPCTEHHRCQSATQVLTPTHARRTTHQRGSTRQRAHHAGMMSTSDRCRGGMGARPRARRPQLRHTRTEPLKTLERTPSS